MQIVLARKTGPNGFWSRSGLVTVARSLPKKQDRLSCIAFLLSSYRDDKQFQNNVQKRSMRQTFPSKVSPVNSRFYSNKRPQLSMATASCEMMYLVCMSNTSDLYIIILRGTGTDHVQLCCNPLLVCISAPCHFTNLSPSETHLWMGIRGLGLHIASTTQI